MALTRENGRNKRGGNLYCNFFESLCLFCYLAKCIILLGQSKEYSFWIV